MNEEEEIKQENKKNEKLQQSYERAIFKDKLHIFMINYRNCSIPKFSRKDFFKVTEGLIDWYIKNRPSPHVIPILEEFLHLKKFKNLDIRNCFVTEESKINWHKKTKKEYLKQVEYTKKLEKMYKEAKQALQEELNDIHNI